MEAKRRRETQVHARGMLTRASTEEGRERKETKGKVGKVRRVLSCPASASLLGVCWAGDRAHRLT